MTKAGGWDAIIVGGGLAGAAAARELRRDGASILLLEARDRLGGRNHSERHDGLELELGGAFVHWWQGQSFTEVQRYGLELDSTPWLAASCFWPGPEGPRAGDIEELREIMLPLLEAFIRDAREILPRPFEPLHGERQNDMDQLSVADRVNSMGLSGERLAILSSLLNSMCSSDLREVGLVPALRWFSLNRWDAVQFVDREHYRVRGGAKRLTEAILGDAGCEIRLETPVASISQDDDMVDIRTRDGDRLQAGAAVLAVPLNTLGAIDLPTQAPPAWRTMAREGTASTGVKVVMRTPPGSPGIVAIGHPEEAITWLVTDAISPDGSTILNGFGPDARRLVGSDLDSVQEAVSRIAPGLEVVEVHSHDWLDDEFSRGTWGLFRPGQLTRLQPQLCAPWGNVVLAASELANCWATFMAGALEAGVRAGQQARRMIVN